MINWKWKIWYISKKFCAKFNFINVLLVYAYKSEDSNKFRFLKEILLAIHVIVSKPIYFISHSIKSYRNSPDTQKRKENYYLILLNLLREKEYNFIQEVHIYSLQYKQLLILFVYDLI